MKAGEKSTAARAFYKRVFEVAAQATTEEGTSIIEEVLGQIADGCFSTPVKQYFGLSRCRPASLVCLVPDEIDETDQRDQTDERRVRTVVAIFSRLRLGSRARHRTGDLPV